MLVELGNRRFRVERSEWSGDLYTKYFQSAWRPFISGKLLLRNTFPINNRFLGELNDPGAQFFPPQSGPRDIDRYFCCARL